MKLNKKGFFKGVKALLLIIMLSFTFLFSLGIRGNKPRLMANKRDLVYNAVPNNEYVENVYVNKYMIPQNVVSFLNTLDEQLTYVPNPLAQPSPGTTIGLYVVYCNLDLTKILFISRYVHDNGDPNAYEINLANFQTMESTIIFNNRFNFYDELDNRIWPGWNLSTPQVLINSTLVPSIFNFNIPVGQQNDLLTSLFSVDNSFFDSYSYDEGYDIGNDEGYDMGYNAGYGIGYDEGYEFGYDEGYDIGNDEGYDEGYDIGKEDGYTLGYNAGYNVGSNVADDLLSQVYDNALQEGYEIGFEEGFQTSYNVGYQNGYNDGRLEESPIGLEWFKSAISVLNSFLEIQLLPNVSIGAVLSGFVILVLLKWILAWFRG